MKDKKKDYEVTLEVLEERIENDKHTFKLALFMTFMFYIGAVGCCMLSVYKSGLLGLGVAFTVVTLLIFMCAMASNNQECSRELLYYLKSKEK